MKLHQFAGWVQKHIPHKSTTMSTNKTALNDNKEDDDAPLLTCHIGGELNPNEPVRTPLVEPPGPTFVQQQLPVPEIDDKHWGHSLESNPDKHVLCIVTKNVNTMTDSYDATHWHAAATALTELQAGMFCFQETNTEWTLHWKNKISQVFQKSQWGHCRFEASSSAEVSQSNYQPGGTAIGTLGKWTRRCISTGTDSLGLGHWSYQVLQGCNGVQVIFCSIYQVCDQKFDPESMTTYSQQYWLLENKGIPNPDPHAQFLVDFTSQVQQWHQKGNEVFFCSDINEDL